MYLGEILDGVDKGIIQVEMMATITQKRRCEYLSKRTCIASFSENLNSIKRFRTTFRELKSRQIKNIGDNEEFIPQFLVG